MREDDISRMGPGLFHCPMGVAPRLMPEVGGLLRELEVDHLVDPPLHTVDVKVHMLMPDQYPCIPNWHCDLVPRGSDGKQDWSRVDDATLMYIWLSGPPLTEFQKPDLFTVEPVRARTWTPFGHRDLHRGTKATAHGWRLFIRVAPASVLPPAPQAAWVRRHTQVYLDANNFTW